MSTVFMVVLGAALIGVGLASSRALEVRSDRAERQRPEDESDSE
jgi:hypothetical protein